MSADELAVWLCEQLHGHSDIVHMPAEVEDELRRVAAALLASPWISALTAEIEQLHEEVHAGNVRGDLLRDDARDLRAEVVRLRAEVAREERAHSDTIADRDRIHEVADQLAYSIAPMEVIGEHSSGNDPWQNALDGESQED
jgi:hypothetical protein